MCPRKEFSRSVRKKWKHYKQRRDVHHVAERVIRHARSSPWTKEYIGPHALLKAFLRVLDPRDAAPGERLADLAVKTGRTAAIRSSTASTACPKKLNPTQAIETLRKAAQKRQALSGTRGTAEDAGATVMSDE